jgi:cytochrome P450
MSYGPTILVWNIFHFIAHLRADPELEWHNVSVKDTIAHLIAKLSTRVFLGEELAHNADLEKVIVNYTHVGLEAIMELKKWSPILRPVVHWYIPQVQASRQMVKHARELLRPEQERRSKEKVKCLAEGEPLPKYPDTLTWAEEVAKRPYDPVALQLGLSLAAVHTTADLLGQAVINLCHYPDWIQPLRDEVTTVLSSHGMNKNSITKLHLLDSYLKETQRLKPIQRGKLQSNPRIKIEVDPRI